MFTLPSFVTAEHAQHRLHPGVLIQGYKGPLTNEFLSFFGNAEILQILDSTITSISTSLFKMPKIFYSNNVQHGDVHPEASNGANNVEEFYYIGGSWEKPTLAGWKRCKNLRILVIKNHKQPFVELVENSLGETKLQHLEVSNSGVKQIDNLAFKNLDKLETLNLRDNKLTTISKECLTPLKSLKNLDLGGNYLTSFNSSELPQLPYLETIDLSNNPLESLSLCDIGQVAPNLKTLCLRDTKIPDSEIQILTKNTTINIIKKGIN